MAVESTAVLLTIAVVGAVAVSGRAGGEAAADGGGVGGWGAPAR